MSYFVAIEGIDGSGKGTQTAALVDFFQTSGLSTGTITFPRYSETLTGKQIGRFLDGQFGTLENLHPIPISLMYATERFESRDVICQKLDDHDLLIADRYVGSNFAHQGARLLGAERQEFLQWIEQVEYGIFKVPRPDLVIVLDLPAEVSAERVARKNARDYTRQVTDLHESDCDYLIGVRDVYLQLCRENEHWHVVNCLTESGEGRSIEEIQNELRSLITAQFDLTTDAAN
ncbi:dTMP kinase [Rubinisphaera margarita]|uniref:dTMP kinase n=1 Tax=Rubinisphaera margarita TaxID=2909586 RepID=UPI001EE90D13|nr:dTMP kinase [Rubinisphaera margarita]MCG6157417.1 dTMP kinase [Rubinisphaera margarita]